MSKQNEDIGLL